MPYLNIIGGILLVVILVLQHYRTKKLLPMQKALADLRYAFLKIAIVVISLYFSMDVFRDFPKMFAIYNLSSGQDTNILLEDLHGNLESLSRAYREFYRTIGAILVFTVCYGSLSIYKFAKAVVPNNEEEKFTPEANNK